MSEHPEQNPPSPEDTSTPPASQDIAKELMEFAAIENLTEADLKDMEDAISENLTADDLKDMQEAIAENQAETSVTPFQPEIDASLEAKLQAELAAKQRIEGVKTVSKEDITEYLSHRRSKIIYHALWHLVFNVEDHIASKDMIYEALKEVTSKNPVEPMEEHKFYFGLGFLLRLQLFDQKIVQFKDGKLKIMVNPTVLRDILSTIGDPISERPILSTQEKSKMFSDFLKDNFLDV